MSNYSQVCGSLVRSRVVEWLILAITGPGGMPHCLLEVGTDLRIDVLLSTECWPFRLGKMTAPSSTTVCGRTTRHDCIVSGKIMWQASGY